MYVVHLTGCLQLNHGTLVLSFYNLMTREVRHDDKPIPISLSALIYLEKLTVHGLVDFDCLANEWTMTTSIPAIANFIKTSSSLKCVSLVLRCLFIANFRKFPIGLFNWGPLVRLLTESSVPSFTLHIDTWYEIPCTAILTSLAKCAELTKLVDKGVLVITPQIPSEKEPWHKFFWADIYTCLIHASLFMSQSIAQRHSCPEKDDSVIPWSVSTRYSILSIHTITGSSTVAFSR